MTRKLLWLLAGLVGVSYVVHLFTLPWTQDEGLYLLAARQISAGKVLYRDFAFQQMPLYPYVILFWQHLFGGGLLAARALSLLSVLLLAIGIRTYHRENSGKDDLWIPLLVIILLHPLAWRYAVIVKPQAFCLAAVFWAWIEAGRARESSGRGAAHAFASGVLVAMAFNTRLLFAGAAVCCFLSLWSFKRRWFPFLAGLVIISVPTLILFISYPEEAYFNWVTYHRLRGEAHLWGQIRSVFLVLGDPAWLSWVILGAGLLKIQHRPVVPWVQRVGLSAFIIFSTLPALRLIPLFDEYFLPLLVFGTVGIFFVAQGCAPFPRAALFSALLTFLFWAPGAIEELRMNFRPASLQPINSIGNVQLVADAIQRYTAPTESVLSWWNGYIVSSGRIPMPGMGEGVAVEYMAGKLSPKESHRYHIATVQDVMGWVERREIPVIVVGLGSPKGFEKIVQQRYRLSEEVGGARLYVRLRSLTRERRK